MSLICTTLLLGVCYLYNLTALFLFDVLARWSHRQYCRQDIAEAFTVGMLQSHYREHAVLDISEEQTGLVPYWVDALSTACHEESTSNYRYRALLVNVEVVFLQDLTRQRSSPLHTSDTSVQCHTTQHRHQVAIATWLILQDIFEATSTVISLYYQC